MNKMAMNDDQLDNVSGGTILPYEVLPGDTLEVIAGKYNVLVDDLKKWNGIQDSNMLMAGQKLKVKF